MIWCLGMYASGSTWLFNATREVAAAVSPEPAISCYAETLKMLAPLRAPTAIKIVKTHQLDRRADAYMARYAGVILLTIRDPRDAVASMMLYMRRDFAEALAAVERSAWYCQRFAADPRTLLLRYESGFIDDPTTLDRLAAACNGELQAPTRAAIFAATRRAAIEARIARLDDLPTTVTDGADVVDLVSQWHRHHANRTGEIGRWRRLLDADAVALIDRRLAGFMAAHGYQQAAQPA